MVEWKKLGDVCEKTSNIKWKDQTDDKIYKYIDLSSVSLNSHKVIVTTDICKQNAPSRAQQIVWANDILLGTTRPTLKRYCQIPSYLDMNICSTGFCIFRANKEYVLSRWLFHNIGSSRFWDYCELKQQGAGYPCLSNSDAFAYMIPIPSLSEQQRIVNILDTFTASIDNLKEQIAQRRKQYEYYRDQLLDLEGKEGVEMKTLGEICDNLDFMRKPITSSKRKAGLYPYYGASGIVDYVEGYIFDGEYLLVSEDGANLVARTYPIAFSIKGKNWVNNHAHVLAFDSKITQKFVEIYLNMIDLSPWINGAAQPKLNQANLNIINIPVPSLSEQQRIVDILDKFEASIQNLEAQLSQREKQYEYYRNKLLTFE